jgi:Tfp pilus assembly protein FimT
VCHPTAQSKGTSCADFGSSTRVSDTDPGQNARQIGMMRRGATLLEMVTSVTLMGAMALLAIPRMNAWRDRLAVQRATGGAAAFYASARFGALLRGSRVRIEFRPDSLLAAYEAVTDSVFLRRGGPLHEGVALHTTHPVIRILPNGLGAGNSNTTLVFRRGIHAESLTTSRLGRLKRWR